MTNIINNIINTSKQGLNAITEESTFKFLKSPIFDKVMILFASYNLIIILLQNTNIQIKNIDNTQLHNQILLSLGLFATIFKISNKFIFSIYVTIFHSILQYYYIQYKKQFPIPILNKIIATNNPNTLTTSSINTANQIIPTNNPNTLTTSSIIDTPIPTQSKIDTISKILVNTNPNILISSPIINNIKITEIIKLPNEIFNKNKLLLYKIVILFIFSYFITNSLFSTAIIFILYFLNNHIS